jgi:hypothetical protein
MNFYLLGLKSLNTSDKSAESFEGFTLVLTNNKPGLRKNGHIHLNCTQVYQEWLNVLIQSKKKFHLLDDIFRMEAYLSQILHHIQVCDSKVKLNNINNNDQIDDESVLSLAEYYNHVLNLILNNLTNSFKSLDQYKNESSFNDFSHLQLTVEKCVESFFLFFFYYFLFLFFFIKVPYQQIHRNSIRLDNLLLEVTID